MRRRWISLATALLFVGNLALLCAPGRALAAAPPPQVPVVFIPGTAASFLVRQSDPSYVYWFSIGQLVENSTVLSNIASTANANLIGKGFAFGAWAGALGCGLTGIASLLTLLCSAVGALVGAATGGITDVVDLVSAVTNTKPSDSSDLNKLALNPDGGDPSGSDVVVGGVFRTLKLFGDTGPDLPPAQGNIYQTFFDTLKSWGYDDQVPDGPNKWLYVAPYDWRKDASSNARQYVLPVVLQALHDHYPNGGGKVVLIAHSQGGLVARSFIAGEWKDPTTGQTFRGGDRVAALIAIATPWFGTPRVTQAVSLGWDFGISGINAAWGLRLAPNWPSVYDMMPADDQYFSDYPNGYYYQGGGKQGPAYGEPPLPEAQQNAIISEQNTQAGGNLMAQALAWRAQVLNGQSYGVANYLIAGYIKPGTTGEQIPLSALGEDPTDTIIRVVRYAPQGYHCFFWHCWTYQQSEQDYVDIGPGDNTVPLASALAWSPSNGPLPGWPQQYDYISPTGVGVSQSVIGPFKYYLVTDQTGRQKSQAGHKAKHMHLPNNHHVLDTIRTILSNVLVVTSTSLPSGTIGQPYSTQFTATGGQPPYTWAPGTLPGWSTPVDPSAAGLTLSPDGTLSGTLLSSFALPVTVTDSAGNTDSVVLDVQGQNPPMAMGPMPSFDAGAYNSGLAVPTGGAVPFVDGQRGVPNWLTIQCSKTLPSNCLLSGTPPQAGTYPFQLHLFDAGPGTTQWLDVSVVVHPQPSIVPPSGIGVAPGQLIQWQFQATDGVGPYRWSIAGPDWLHMAQNGLLSGTPPSSGRWTVKVTVKDAAGGQDSQSAVITAMDPLEITTKALPDGTVGHPYMAPPLPMPAVPMKADGGVSPYTWSMAGACIKNCSPCDFHPGPGLQATYGARVVPLRPQAIRLASPAPAASPREGLALPPLRLGGRCPGPVDSPLPPGLKLLNGSLVGTPQEAGTFTLMFTVTDSIGDREFVTLNLVVDAASGGSDGQSTPTPPSQPSPSTQTTQPVPPAPSGTPTGTFSPTSASPGQTVTLSGTAAPDSFMSVYLYCSGCGANGTHAGTAQVGSDGSYSLSFQVPSGAQPGSASVQAGCDTCGNSWSTFSGLTIVAAPQTSTPPAPAPYSGTPTGSFSPSSASPGGSVTLSGTAEPGSFMSVYLYCSGCDSNGTHAGTAQVGSDGSYSLTFQVPSGAQPGAVTVTAGCDTCGNGWNSFSGLTITPGGTGSSSANSGGTQPQPPSGQTLQPSGAAASPVPSPAPSPAPSQPSGPPVVTGVNPPAGPDGGGATVTLTGSNLSGATSVSFGDFGQAQIDQIASDGTSLQVTTPQAWWGDGAVYVQVTTPAGQSAVTSADQYTYQAGPASQPGSGSGGPASGAGGGASSSTTAGPSSGSPAGSSSSGSNAGGPMGITPAGVPVNCDSPSLTPFDKQVDGCP